MESINREIHNAINSKIMADFWLFAGRDAEDCVWRIISRSIRAPINVKILIDIKIKIIDGKYNN